VQITIPLIAHTDTFLLFFNKKKERKNNKINIKVCNKKERFIKKVKSFLVNKEHIKNNILKM